MLASVLVFMSSQEIVAVQMALVKSDRAVAVAFSSVINFLERKEGYFT